MLRTTTVVEKVDEDTIIISFSFEARKCVLAKARDFCVLQTAGKHVDTGSYVVAGRSVKHPECPRFESVLRGEVLIAGWVIRPSVKTPRCSNVTYVAQIDPKGSVPQTFANYVSRRHPLCLRALAKYFETTRS